MKATHKVKDSNKNTIGYIINGEFYTRNETKESIKDIENIKLLNNGTLRCSKILPEIDYKQSVIKERYKELCKKNPFYRDIQVGLENWRKNYHDKVLQLEGARQVGKTTELLKFGYKNYEYIIYVDLNRDSGEFIEYIKSNCKPLYLETYCRKTGLPSYVDDRSTLLIIDEIQTNYMVYNHIRALRSNLKCDIIVTGSYLGRILGNKNFFLPAGTIITMDMLPLSFCEFCDVFNCKDILLNLNLYGEDKIDNYNKLNELYKIYLLIGGYPNVISRYIETQSIKECHNVLNELLNLFSRESRLYFQDDREVEIFAQVYEEAINLMNREKRGDGKNILQDLVDSIKAKNVKVIISRQEVSRAITWLIYGGIISVCDLARDGDLSNKEYARRMYFTDCGIASYIASKSNISESNLIGLLSETFVHSELLRLYKEKYIRDSRVNSLSDRVCFGICDNYELDFIVRAENKDVYGIEVKAKDGTYTSLKVFLKKRFVDKGIVAKFTKGGHGDNFEVIPIYTVGCRFPYK